MGALAYFQSAMKNLHQEMIDAVKDLTEEQLHFRPMDKGNHIAFIIWHYVRTEDTVLNFLVQKKKPVWNAEEWDKRLGLDPRAQGTGMSAEDAAAVKIKDMKLFLEYVGCYEDPKSNPRDGRMFKPRVDSLHAGTNRIVITNAMQRELTINRVNLGLW